MGVTCVAFLPKNNYFVLNQTSTLHSPCNLLKVSSDLLLMVFRITSGGKQSQQLDQAAWQHCLLSDTWPVITCLWSSTRYALAYLVCCAKQDKQVLLVFFLQIPLCYFCCLIYCIFHQLTFCSKLSLVGSSWWCMFSIWCVNSPLGRQSKRRNSLLRTLTWSLISRWQSIKARCFIAWSNWMSLKFCVLSHVFSSLANCS